MRKLHLVKDDTNPYQFRMYCKLRDQNDTLNWTYNRRKLLSHPNPCNECIKRSKPEVPLPAGFAAAQLNKLQYYNQLSRNPQPVPLGKMDKKILEILMDGIESATIVALQLDEEVSNVIKILNRLFNAGVVTKVRNRWIAAEDPLPIHFKLVDPTTVAAGRILHRA